VAQLIGTDEAGYGPSLGPLVITATHWRCPQRDSNLYELLADVVTDSPKVLKKSGSGQRILVADSKVACRSGAIGKLELSVLVLLRATYGKTPETLTELVAMVMPDVAEDFFQIHFWLKNADVKLPLASANRGLDAIDQLSKRFQDTCAKKEVELCAVSSAILLPPEFNTGVTNHGNKASLLSHRTLRLVSDLLAGGREDTLIECDKHGGRNYYCPIISETLTGQPVTTLVESPATSIYQWTESSPVDRKMEIRFTAKGEDQLSVALASMVSKYVREIFMAAWNDFWIKLVPGIKPTKGYPQDAKRFLADIEKTAAAKRYPQQDFLRSC